LARRVLRDRRPDRCAGLRLLPAAGLRAARRAPRLAGLFPSSGARQLGRLGLGPPGASRGSLRALRSARDAVRQIREQGSPPSRIGGALLWLGAAVERGRDRAPAVRRPLGLLRTEE